MLLRIITRICCVIERVDFITSSRSIYQRASKTPKPALFLFFFLYFLDTSFLRQKTGFLSAMGFGIFNRQINHSFILRQQSFPAFNTALNDNSQVNITYRFLHGYMDKDKKQPASIVIFHAQLISRRGRIRRFKLDLDFSQTSKVNTEASSMSALTRTPKIISHAPFREPEALDKMHICMNDKATEQAKLGLSAGLPVGMGGSIEVLRNRVVEKRFARPSFTRGISGKRGTPGSKEWSAVWWEVEERGEYQDAGDAAGVPPRFAFAVLLERAADEEFQANIRVSWKCNLWHAAEKIVAFEPSRRAGGRPPGNCFSLRLNPGNRLGQWKDEEKIAELVRRKSWI